MIIVVAIDSTGRLIRDPEIITRGLVHVDASQDVPDELRAELRISCDRSREMENPTGVLEAL